MSEPTPIRMPPKMQQRAHLHRAGELLNSAEELMAEVQKGNPQIEATSVIALANLAFAHFAAAHAVELLPHQ